MPVVEGCEQHTWDGWQWHRLDVPESDYDSRHVGVAHAVKTEPPTALDSYEWEWVYQTRCGMHPKGWEESGVDPIGEEPHGKRCLRCLMLLAKDGRGND